MTSGESLAIKSWTNKARAAWKTGEIWSATNIGVKMKVKLFKSLARSVLIYRSESWKFTKTGEDNRCTPVQMLAENPVDKVAADDDKQRSDRLGGHKSNNRRAEEMTMELGRTCATEGR